MEDVVILVTDTLTKDDPVGTDIESVNDHLLSPPVDRDWETKILEIRN